MKFQYCSDLHLEFPENKRFLKMNPLDVTGDVLLLAGDVVPFAQMDKHKDFFDFVADNYQHTYWVPGNHEYYYSDAAQRSGTLNEQIRSNVSLVNNIVIDHDHVRLIFSTMWSKINPTDEWQIERGMSDFQVIKYNGYRFSVPVCNRLHDACLQFIKQEVEYPTDKMRIVVTHHVPTFMHYPEQYRGDMLNQAFAVELYDFIHQSDILYWQYGHHHTNTPDFKIGNTQMITNQLGYVQYGENGLFSSGKCFVVA